MMNTNQTVVLVHGLGGSRLDMWPIARRLKRAGYRVRNWGYRSIGNRIETHAERLGRDLKSLDEKSNDSRFHMVTFSMGSIIARTVFENEEFENLGRVVMLAPPNHGSHIARKLMPYFGWLTPALAQLSDAADSYVNQLSSSLDRIEFGIVEAKRDRVIADGGVHLEGHRDFVSVDGHHGVLTWYPQTIQLVESFLSDGYFSGETSRDQHRVAGSADCLASATNSFETE